MSTIAVNNITDEQGSGRPAFSNGVQTSNINGGQVGGRRNLIINGAMQVAQRGTSATVSEGNNEGYSTLDRWILSFGSNCPGEIEFSRSNDAPDGFSNSIKLSCTSAAASLSDNENLVLSQPIEGQDLQSLASGTGNEKTLTLSFWAKANNFNDVISVAFRSYDSGGNLHDLVREFSGITNTWTRYEFTITANDLSDIVNDNTQGFRVAFYVAANGGSGLATNTFNTWQSGKFWSANNGNFVSSTANEFYLTGVQLEVGDTATEFEHRSYGEELALCQRYYQDQSDNGSSLQDIPVAHYGSNAFWQHLITPMRVAPSVNYTVTDYYEAGNGRTFGSVSMQNITEKYFDVVLLNVGGTNGNAGLVYFKYELDAEL